MKSKPQNQVGLGKSKPLSKEPIISEPTEDDDKVIEEICDENLDTLNKIHAILVNCSNLSKNQKLEFCESERYFMKLYLKKLMKQNEKK